MLAVSTRLPATESSRPHIVLTPGSFATSLIWIFWQEELAKLGWTSHASDLRGHGHSTPMDLSRTSLADYVSDIHRVVQTLKQPPIMMGWSMGGLLSMLYSTTYGASACIGMAPTPPANKPNTTFVIEDGEYSGEIHGMTDKPVEDQPLLPDLDLEERRIVLDAISKESRYAMGERMAGAVIGSLPCPLLVVTGADDITWPKDAVVAEWLNPDRYVVDGASHWGLVMNRRAIATAAPVISGWLSDNL